MEYLGILSKMRIENEKPVRYFLNLDETELYMNDLIGFPIEIKFEGIIHCIACGRKIKKAFGQGFCYPCFMNSPLNSECILKPELCQAHEGGGRDPEWEEKNHNQPHYIYLAQTSGVKVGVTRMDQIPTRWVDQGAWKAIKLALTPYRFLAGKIELYLKQYLADKTPWQKMLKNEVNEIIDLEEEKKKIIEKMDPEYQSFILSSENDIYTFEYPVLRYPVVIKSINLDKSPHIQAKLSGIRGQYLIFENGEVINLRKYSGYEITLTV